MAALHSDVFHKFGRKMNHTKYIQQKQKINFIIPRKHSTLKLVSAVFLLQKENRMSELSSRRDALRLGFGICVGLPAVTFLNACTQCSKPSSTGGAPTAAPESAPAQAQESAADLVSETDPTATALNFKQNAADVPAELQKESNGVPFANQRCANCMFYNAADGADVGMCQLLPSGKVKAGGWCASWSAKG